MDKQESTPTEKQDATQNKRNQSLNILNYDVLEFIFRHLNSEQLSNAAKVCRLWLEVANIEKEKRSPKCIIGQAISCDSKLQKLLQSRSIANCMGQLRIKPSVALIFISANQDDERVTQEYFYRSLPKSCTTIMLSTTCSIFGNNGTVDFSITSVVCAFFPQTPNVHINVFKTKSSVRCYDILKYCRVLNKISEPNSEKSACLILFGNGSQTYQFIHGNFLILLNTGSEIRVNMWSGIVKNVITLNSANTSISPIYSSGVALLISGSIQTWSTVLDESCDTEERIEEILKSFKDQVKLKEHTVGFMFSTKFRKTLSQDNTISEAYTQARIFTTLFPTIPLVGCCGLQPIGKNTTKRKAANTEYLQLSTSFMILTY